MTDINVSNLLLNSFEAEGDLLENQQRIIEYLDHLKEIALNPSTTFFTMGALFGSVPDQMIQLHGITGSLQGQLAFSSYNTHWNMVCRDAIADVYSRLADELYPMITLEQSQLDLTLGDFTLTAVETSSANGMYQTNDLEDI